MGETLLHAKNCTGHWWDSNPGPCRQHGHCCKRAKPLRHLALYTNLYTNLTPNLWKYKEQYRVTQTAAKNG